MNMRVKKADSIFGRYPCCDLLNRALGFLLEGKIDGGIDDIVLAIEKADGYFYEHIKKMLEERNNDKT